MVFIILPTNTCNLRMAHIMIDIQLRFYSHWASMRVEDRFTLVGIRKSNHNIRSAARG